MEEEVEEFEEGTMTGPALCPMRPYLNSTWHTIWNDALCDMFVEHFEEEEGIELMPDIKTKIKNMFLDSLSCLVRPYREWHAFSIEELYERELKSNQKSRRNMQRVDLSQLWNLDIPMLTNYSSRQRATSNMLRELEESWWKITADMVEELGPAGMGSYDSELDENT